MFRVFQSLIFFGISALVICSVSVVDQFDCGNGQFVSRSALCDRDNDCRNGADERNCSNVPSCVTDLLFECGNGLFIRKNMVCNRVNDCRNMADERNCDYLHTRRGLINTGKQLQNYSLNLKVEEEINSPNYPSDYPHFSNIIWNVTTAPGHRIKVVFKAFELEDSNSCTADYLKFYDGSDISYTTLGTYCRHDQALPAPVTSVSNVLNIHFKSDHSIAWSGFSLSLTPVCGGLYLAQTDEQVLVSHTKYGAKNYTEYLTCDWIIKSSTERKVQIKFTDFDIEDITAGDCGNTNSVNCVQFIEPQDYVEVFDGPDDSSIRLGKFFGHQLPPTITSQGEELLIRFRSDEEGSSRGFRATYKEV